VTIEEEKQIFLYKKKIDTHMIIIIKIGLLSMNNKISRQEEEKKKRATQSISF